nr:precorrin-3B C(17)-methyltransferase [Gammaproteobacteria bacterium]
MNEGKIHLVGIGPGAKEHMSLRARQAIAESDVVIGHTTYIRLVKDLLDGKQVVRKGMTEEIDRCVEAYEQAKLGKTVALVSSGDIGVYGMAGPAYEVLLQSGWTPASGIAVEVVPGSTALSACASLVGAPLTHDFCAISLSDLLTPWPTIAKRLEGAGRSDFVVALYNPKSGRRTRHIAEAQRILLQYRKPDTPVAIVKSAYREGHDVQVVRLEEMKDCQIGMRSTVLIGNSSSYVREGLMITPRGYTNKYRSITGDVKDEEKAGRSLSMGLEGWKACVRKHLCTNEVHSLRDIARYFDVPVGEILSAISQADVEDRAGDYAAVPVRTGAEAAVLEAARTWGRLRVVVGSDTGALSELLLNAAEFKRRGVRLNVENEHFHLHIDWSRVQHAWLVRRSDSLRSVHFTDAAGYTVFSLALLHTNGRFEAGKEQEFDEGWREFGADRQWMKARNDGEASEIRNRPEGATVATRFSALERDSLYRIIAARRDMRHFAPGAEVDEEALARILEAAHRAPSVGLMQPWRFIRISNDRLRRRIAELVAHERDATATALGERNAEFLRLKVEGIRECAEVLVAALAPDDGTVFGRRTMPEEMALCSVACAIQNMWLAARAENLGLGWVSMFDPAALA